MLTLKNTVGITISLIAAGLSAQPQPYVHTQPAVRHNNIGTYPNLKNKKAWNGLEPGNYSMKFCVKGVNPGDTVYLADYHLDGKYLRDTTVVDRKGMANFNGNFKMQRGMYLFVMPHMRSYFEFVLDDDQDFTINTDTAYYTGEYYKNMKVEGSVQNAAYADYQREKAGWIRNMMDLDKAIVVDSSQANVDAVKVKRDALMKQKGLIDKNYMLNNPDHYLTRFLWAMEDVDIPQPWPLKDGKVDSAFPYHYYKAHYFDNVDLNEDGLVRSPVNILKQKLDYYFDKVEIPDADSSIKIANWLMERSRNSIEVEHYIIWYLTNRFESSNIMGMDKAFVFMAQTTYCNGRAWWSDSTTVTQMCENARTRAGSLIGNIGAPIELMDKDSNWINTNYFRAPYKILIFWDATCGHCKEVIPKLAKIQADNISKGWKVIALSSSDHRPEWIDYLKTHPEVKDWTHLIRGTVRSEAYAANLQSYYVIASPTIFILDENNIIKANRIDVEKIPEFIEHLELVKKREAEGKL